MATSSERSNWYSTRGGGGGEETIGRQSRRTAGDRVTVCDAKNRHLKGTQNDIFELFEGVPSFWTELRRKGG